MNLVQPAGEGVPLAGLLPVLVIAFAHMQKNFRTN